MTYEELYDKANRMLDNSEITIGEYETMIEPLKVEIKPERKTGKWIKSDIGGAKVCSVCQAHMGLSSFKFCPNCGADMKSEDNT